MNRVLILYAPDEGDLKKAAEQLKKGFVAEKFHAELKAVAQSGIQDIAASDIIIVGFKGAEKKVHPDFAEIARALTGINLAGRVTGLFTFDTEAAMKPFSKAFSDSDITIVDSPLLLNDDKKTGAIAAEWIKKITAIYKEGLDARKIQS